MQAKLTLQQLHSYLNHRRCSPGDDIDIVSDLCENTLVDFLGAAWVEQYIRGRRGVFFRSTSETPGDGAIFYDRLIALAEMLFNLQDVPGIEAVIDRMRTGEVEPVFAELETAKFLMDCGLRFAFRLPSSKLGADYDLDIELPDHSLLACDAKCKLEGRHLSQKTVENTLNDGRKQLPKDRPGVLILKIPEHWIRDVTIAETMNSALRRTFGRTGRISGVIVWWEQWEQCRDGGAIKRVKYRVELNGSARYPIPSGLFESTHPRPEWVDFVALAGYTELGA